MLNTLILQLLSLAHYIYVFLMEYDMGFQSQIC